MPPYFRVVEPVRLGKGDKEFVQLLLAHADTLIADGKEQRDVFTVHTFAEDFDFDGSVMRKFDGIGNEIQHDLADAQRIADQYVGNAGSIWVSKDSFAALALGSLMLTTSRTSFSIDNVFFSISSFPDSIFEKSNTSLMMDKRFLAESSILRR